MSVWLVLLCVYGGLGLLGVSLFWMFNGLPIWAKRLRHRLFGTVYVILIDHDKEHNVRAVHYRFGKPGVDRMGMNIHTCFLNYDGTLENGRYVTHWEPFLPNHKKWHPNDIRVQTVSEPSAEIVPIRRI